MKKRTAILLMLMTLAAFAWAQMPGGTAVQVSHKTQTVNGKLYFIHVVEQGQTVYAISRAYGLKEVEAVTKKDIHFLQIGDTVWLPCKGQKLSDGYIAPSATSTATSTASNTATSSSKATTTKDAPLNLGPVAVIRPRINPQSIVVSLMMPLNLSQMDKISTSKFDVEQRGKTSYKSLEFIQFYEGILMGLEQLEKQGYNVTMNVVDVEGTTDADVEKAFTSHNVAQSDLLIAMLTRQPFEKAAALAKENQLFIVNPASTRPEIVANNPYVFKCMPSYEAMAKRTVASINSELPGAPVFIMYSKSKSEKASVDALTAALDEHPEMHYTLVDWAQSAKFTNTLKASGQSAVISLYDQDKAKNRIYSSQLLNKLAAFKSKTPYLYTYDDWSTDYSDIDYGQLQSLNYHTFYTEWDRDNAQEKDFIDSYTKKYSSEPTNVYAGMAHDIIIYFVSGLQQKGTDFFRSPTIAAPKGMLYPLSFSHTRADYGFENQHTVLYRLNDFHFTPVQ